VTQIELFQACQVLVDAFILSAQLNVLLLLLGLVRRAHCVELETTQPGLLPGVLTALAHVEDHLMDSSHDKVINKVSQSSQVLILL